MVHLNEPMLWLPILDAVPPESAAVGTFHAAGDLAAIGDLDDLASHLLTDPQLRARLATQGREKAASLSWEVVAGKVADMYAATLRERSTPVSVGHHVGQPEVGL